MRIRQVEHIGEADEVVTVGTEAVEENNQLFGSAAFRCTLGAGEECG